MGLSLKEIRQQAMKINKAKGGKGEKILRRTKLEDLKREVAMHTKRKDEIMKIIKDKVLKIKDPIFKYESEAMWKTFERMIDKKDNQIQYMIMLMNLADDQLQHTVEYYCECMDKMINNFFCDLETLAEENKKRFDKCIKAGKDSIKNVLLNQQLAETHIQLLLFDTNSKAESDKWTKRGLYLVKEGGKCTNYANKRESLRQYLVYMFFDLWGEYSSVFRTYINNTAQIQREVRKLREKDKVLTDIVAAQSLRIQQGDDLVKRLRSDLLLLESSKKSKVYDRLSKYRGSCKALKPMLSEGCKLDDKQIKFLVSESSGTIDWLEAAHKKGETILKLAALSRKLETQREKVLPFPNAPSAPSQTTQGTPIDNLLMRKTSSKTSGLMRLWQKISNVKLSYKALVHEKQLLEYEYKFLAQNVAGEKETIINPKSNKYSDCSTMKGVLEVLRYTKQE